MKAAGSTDGQRSREVKGHGSWNIFFKVGNDGRHPKQEQTPFWIYQMNKYILLMVVIPVLCMETEHDRIILRLLRSDDYVLHDLEEMLTPRMSEQRFIEDLAKLNLRTPRMSEIWRRLLRGSHPTRMSSADWSIYSPIIQTLPSDIVNKINITDLDVLEYFGSLEVLTLRQVATFGDLLQTKFGTRLLSDEEMTSRLGNLLCGFTPPFLETLPPHTFSALLIRDVFKNIPSCNREQLRSLLSVGRKYRMFGPPETWNPNTVTALGYLIAGLDASEMRKIRDGSVKGLTPNVIRAVPVHILTNMRLEQLKSLDVPSLLAWRRHTRDATHLLSSAVTTITLTSSLISQGTSQAVSLLIASLSVNHFEPLTYVFVSSCPAVSRY